MMIINTLKCNFKCDHCLVSSGNWHREYMTRQVFTDAIEMFDDGLIRIIGGEPTLHPDFIWQLQYALWQDVEQVSFATNGSTILTKSGNYTKFYRRLEELSNEISFENLYINVSNDYFHQEYFEGNIKDVVSLLRGGLRDVGGVNLYRENSQYVLPIGRAKKFDLGNLMGQDNFHAECYEEDFFEPTILPNGDVAFCCNVRQILGNIKINTEGEIRERAMELNEKMIQRDVRKKDCGNCPKFSKLNVEHQYEKNKLKQSNEEQFTLFSKCV